MDRLGQSFGFFLVSFYALAVFVILKWKTLQRDDIFENHFFYFRQDILIFSSIALLLFFIQKPLRSLLFFLFAIFTLNILFISKTGYPITQSLLTQLGDFMILQTSVKSPSIYRNILILFGLCGVFLLTAFFPWPRALKHKGGALLGSILLLLNMVLWATLFWQPKIKKPQFSYNLFYSLSKKPSTISHILNRLETEYEVEKNFPSLPQRAVPLFGKIKYKRIVVVVIETLSFQALGSQWKTIMPHTNKLAQSGEFFQNHYTPWPFSSKALYSLICGVYPHASNLIELRLLSQKSCDGWIETLGQQGFESYVGYTGGLNYDNMGSFFKSQNFNRIRGKEDFLVQGHFSQNDLSVDDKAMFDDYLQWSDKRTKSVGLLITMNSHFPFWAPGNFETPFKDPYKRALNYQDSLVGHLLAKLKASHQFEDTMIVITGDHGPRTETHSDFSPIFFKVPLIIWTPKSTRLRTTSPSTHSEISRYMFAKHEPDLHDIYLYSDFSEFKIARVSPEGIDIFNSDSLTISTSPNWKQPFENCENLCKGKAQLFYEFLKKNKNQYPF